MINNGVNTSTGGYIYYYLSADATITSADTFIGNATVGGIPGGESLTVTTSVIIPSNLVTGTYYIGAIADATNTNTETNESNNTASVAITINGTSPNGPVDLAISSIVPPASANAGDTITVPTTVINNGTGTSVEAYVYYYISADPTIEITDTYLGYKIIGGIDGGTTQNATASLILPSNLAGGTYYIGAIVDPTNSNTETDVTNNTASSSITVNGVPLNGPIDLAISSMTPPASANMGEMITMPVTVINNGTGRSVGSYIFYYLSTDPVITNADRYLGYHHVSDIDGGWTHSMMASIMLPTNIYSGTYYIGAIVDPTNTNAESDETNNTAAAAITINGIPTGPVDLAISSITPPASANAGDTITVPTTAINNGTGTSTGTYIYYYLSTDPVITYTDTYIGDKTVGGIAGGGSQSTTGSVILPSNLTTGTYYIGAVVDATNANDETDETNNTASSPITINGTLVNGPVDLAISSLTPPASANAGATITVPTTAINNGTGTSIGAYIYYYLSTDPVITSADTFIGDTTIGGIAGGGSHSVSPSVILPTNLTTGTYYIGAIVDAGNTNAETDETNNTASAAVTIDGIPVNGPVDLAISSITPPASANAGDTITVPTTAINNGTGTSTGTYIHYYLSPDPVITHTDTYIGDKTVGGIAGGGSQSTTGSVILPSNLTSGTYYIGAVVDATNANDETDETNNTASSTITINGTPPVTGQPDLTVTSIMVPGNAVRGTSVLVPVTITNIGTALSTGTYVFFYLSTDANITSADKYLASKTVGGLSSGGSQNITGSVYIPTNTTPGPYYIGVIVDSTNANAESNELNNTAAGPVAIAQ